MSSRPVRYSSGEIGLETSDITTSGFGNPWGHTRSYSSRLSNSFNFGNGYNWQVTEWTYLSIQPDQGVVAVMGSALQTLWFDQSGNDYVPRFNVRETLQYDPVENVYRVYELAGGFTEYSGTTGILTRRVDAFGNTLMVISTLANGLNLGEVQRTMMSGDDLITESFVYTYENPDAADPLLHRVVLQRKIGGGSWQNIQETEYSYYQAGDPFGSAGDLEWAETSIFNGTDMAPLGKSYYRYYVDGSSSSSSSSSSSGGISPGPHLLRYVLGPAAYNRLAADPAVSDPLTAPNDIVFLYSDYAYEYDANRRVTQEVVRSASQTFQFEAVSSGFADDYNAWSTKTIETLPDGNQNIVYCNYAGQPMLKVFQAGEDQWCEFFRYGADAKILLTAQPAAITGFDEELPDLLNYDAGTGTFQYLRDNDGLINTYEYHPPTGWVTSEKIQRGQLGICIRLRDYEYTAVYPSGGGGGSSSSSSSSSSSGSPVGPPIYVLSRVIVYPDDGCGCDCGSSSSSSSSSCAPGCCSNDGTRQIITEYAYTFYPDTFQIQQMTTTLPMIPVEQNGSGIAATNKQYFDPYGKLIWAMDERGFITGMSYDIPTGAMTQRIDDVDTGLVDAPAGWSTPSGGGQHLITDFEFDAQGRQTQSLGPWHPIDLKGTSTNIRRANWTVYQDATFQTWTAQGFATGDAPDYEFTLVNPVSITIMDAGGKILEQIAAVREDTAGKLDPSDSFPQSSYCRWTTTQFTDCCFAASRRVYHTIPTSGPGDPGTNYDETDYGYDIMKRQNRVVTPGGTITDRVHDTRGNVIGVYIGTNDTGATETDPTGGGALGNNMVVVTENEFDHGEAGGDGNLTQVTQYVDAITERVTQYLFDWRDREVAIDGEIDFYQSVCYDNRNNVIRTDRRDTTANGNLIGRNEVRIDDQGRTYRAIQFAVTPTTALIGNPLVDDFWFDFSGNAIKSKPSGSQLFTKTQFDSLGRTAATYRGYDAGETSYLDACSVSDDVIMEQVEFDYDAASNTIQGTARLRFHTASATQTGPLNDPSTTPKARVIYQAQWQDPVGRIVAAADYGTNGGTMLSRPDVIPVGSDTLAIARFQFYDRGNLSHRSTPSGRVTHIDYDNADRAVTVIENNFDVSSSSSSSSSSSNGCERSEDKNRTIRVSYTPDGGRSALTVENAETGPQKTTFTYGTTLADSDIATSMLLRAVSYPDSTDDDDIQSFTYYRTGDRKTFTDQRGCVHEYEFDPLGRPTHDKVITLGTSVDGAIRRMSFSFDVRGLTTRMLSYDSPTVGSGSLVNEVALSYNSFGQLVTDTQSHSGAITVGVTPWVEVQYADGSSNTIRPTAIVYPNGRSVTYDYGLADGMSDACSRVESITDEDSTVLAAYSMLGVAIPVIADYAVPSVMFTLASLTGTVDPDTGDIHSGLDRLGRIKECRWYNTEADQDVVRLKYDYNRSNNRRSRIDLVAESFGKSFDETYAHDGLQRLICMQRGTIDSGHQSVTDKTLAQCWTLDSTGNWTRFKDASSGGAWTLDQGRTSNGANEITDITTFTGVSWSVPYYDRAGNSTVLPDPADPTKSYVVAYDAWNRPVLLTDPDSEDIIQENSYDPRTFRTIRKDYTSGVLAEERHFYYSPDWRAVEERLGASPDSTDPMVQSVWGIRYIDDLILRDRDSDQDGTIEERLFACQDSNWNVVSIIDPSGAVQERYSYTAYGVPEFLTDLFGSRGTSAFAWENLYAGYRHDDGTRLCDARNRFLHPLLGCWINRDLIVYADGFNLYEYVQSRPITALDPFGLLTKGGCPDGYEQQHWFPQQFKKEFNSKCGKLAAMFSVVSGSTKVFTKGWNGEWSDLFTTCVFGKAKVVGTQHWFLHDRGKFNYNNKVKAILDELDVLNGDCCSLLNEMIEMINNAWAAMAKFSGYGSIPELTYRKYETKYKWTNDILAQFIEYACRNKCRGQERLQYAATPGTTLAGTFGGQAGDSIEVGLEIGEDGAWIVAGGAVITIIVIESGGLAIIPAIGHGLPRFIPRFIPGLIPL